MSYNNYNHNQNDKKIGWKQIVGGGVLGGALLGGFLLTRYKVCKPTQIMVRMGMGINGMTISTKGFHFPFQKLQMVNLTPQSKIIALNSMSSENIPLHLPVAVTYAPYKPNENPELFKKYAQNMTDINSDEIEKLLDDLCHGELRSLTNESSVMDILSKREIIREKITNKLQTDFDKIGIELYNVNIGEIKDTVGSEFFKYLKLRAIETASNQSKIDVAKAKREGDIGQQEQNSASRQKIAEFEAETIKIENNRKREIEESNKNLAIATIEYNKQQQLAQIEAKMEAQQKEIELKKILESKRVEQEIETLRAKDLVLAKVNAESIIEKAEGDAQSQKKIADALLYTETKRAEGIKLVAGAKSEAITKLLASTADNPQLLQFHWALESGLYEKLAKTSADAIRDLKPDIRVWNTGASGNNDPYKSIRDLMTSIPPMLDVLKQQTDIKIPDLFAGLSDKKTE